MPKGKLIIISAPSGTGKSTICRRLLQRRRNLKCSISCTTRALRPGERHGRHYYFLAPEEFKRKIQRNEFLEWAIVHDHYYGTPRQPVETALRDGIDLLLAIDVQGAAAIRRKVPDSVLIFLAPPSLESLRERLAARRDPSESVAKRLANSKTELERIKNYDYLVINEHLEEAVSQIEAILTAEGLKVSRREISDLALV